MKDKILYIIDIRFRQKNVNLSKYLNSNSEILSLTPYANYLIDNLHLQYKTFHDFILIEKFHKTVLEKYNILEISFSSYREYSFIFRDLAMVITYETYMKLLFQYLEEKRKESYKLVYITDLSCTDDIFEFNIINQTVSLNNKDKYFYIKNSLFSRFIHFLNTKDIWNKIYNRYFDKSKDILELKYDNRNYKEIFNKFESFDIKQIIATTEINSLINKLENSLLNENQYNFVRKKYINILNNFKELILKQSSISTIKIHPFTFISKSHNYMEVLLYQANKIPKVFMQHGSYMYENIFLKYNEIYPADINLVFNEYTKSLFEKRGAKKVYVVGSIDFTYQIIEKEKKYDFLYIVYCTAYSYDTPYISSVDSIYNTDTNSIYNRHKAIIKLFGSKFKDKRICIKLQPGIMLGTMLYIPLLELSKDYPNITIEFSIPIQNLIQESKYIISDYFSSEFINYELHYKRDIILFKDAPLSLPKETLKDMDKMFILVDTVDDLEDKIKNIEEITKNRKRYDDIIEYYSSKKCDTKKIVTKILEKELNGR